MARAKKKTAEYCEEHRAFFAELNEIESAAGKAPTRMESFSPMEVDRMIEAYENMGEREWIEFVAKNVAAPKGVAPRV